MNINKIKKAKLVTLAVFFISAFQASSSFALDNSAVNSAIDNGVSVLEIQQNLTEGGWGNAGGMDYIYTAAAVEALHTANQRTGAYYSGVAWLENHHANNTDLGARKVAALVERGNNIEPDLALIHAAKRDVLQSGWGLSGGYNSSALESALVLQALYQANDTTGQSEAINYLLAEQLLDGGWSTAESTSSHYWITAEVVLALANHQAQPGVSAALSQASTFLSAANVSLLSSVTLARVSLALHALHGVNPTVDSQISILLTHQVSAGDWGDVLSTSVAITTLAYAVGLNTLTDSTHVAIDQEQLRTAINQQLGYAAYGHITEADINSLTSLDLRSASITNLNGLEGATNLNEIKINASTDTSALAGLSGLTIIVDSDSDNIVDANDNCPLAANVNQANLDGDSQGDICDYDIDGDTMPNSWEGLYAFNAYNASDATQDPDTDQLINRDEYIAGTDPHDPDFDSDFLLDGVEVLYGLDPHDATDAGADFDYDELTNAEEIAWGTDLFNADTDNDNTSDGEEVLIGRNPLVNEPVLIVIITGLLL